MSTVIAEHLLEPGQVVAHASVDPRVPSGGTSDSTAHHPTQGPFPGFQFADERSPRIPLKKKKNNCKKTVRMYSTMWI